MGYLLGIHYLEVDWTVLAVLRSGNGPSTLLLCKFSALVIVAWLNVAVLTGCPTSRPHVT